VAHKTFLTTVGTVSDGCRSLLADRNRTWDGHPPRNEESDLSTDPSSSGLKIRTQGIGGCVPCPWPLWGPDQISAAFAASPNARFASFLACRQSKALVFTPTRLARPCATDSGNCFVPASCPESRLWWRSHSSCRTPSNQNRLHRGSCPFYPNSRWAFVHRLGICHRGTEADFRFSYSNLSWSSGDLL